TSIVQIIGERTTLSPAGNYQKGLCPFHHEKSPSFFVNDTLGFYKCFGCGEGGDVLDFLQKYDNLTFKEALEMLAERAGIQLTQHTFDKDDALREKLLALLAAAADYYQENLAKSAAAAPMRAYLKQRQMTAQTIKLFRLGAALDTWQGVTDFLSNKKFSPDEIVASGLGLRNKTGRLYDRFRNRLMFPLKNHRGQVVGFSGRIIDNSKKDEAKYMNTPETLLYHKGKMLYGLSELSQEIKKEKVMLIVEGEFDMLSSVQAQVDYVCAIKGSALTADHAQLISRYVKKVILALDRDAAGVAATKRAISILRPEGIDLRVVMIDQGKDPDEFARHDPSGWREKVKSAVSVYDFFLSVILASHDKTKIDEQKTIVQELASVFALIDNQLEYEFYLKKLAAALDQDKEVLRQDLVRWRDFGSAKISPTKVINATTESEKNKKQPTKLEKLEAYIWFLFCQSLSENRYLSQTSSYILQAQWQNRFLQKLTQFYRTYQEKNNNLSLRDFQNSLPADYATQVANLCLNKTFVRFVLKNDLWQEWQKATLAQQKMLRTSISQNLQKELATFDNLEQLTPEQEKRQKEILQELKKLTSK
ncbi:MAG: DNA primase, partial [bacterium]|nr:DNA primase [bacterium]